MLLLLGRPVPHSGECEHLINHVLYTSACVSRTCRMWIERSLGFRRFTGGRRRTMAPHGSENRTVQRRSFAWTYDCAFVCRSRSVNCDKHAWLKMDGLEAAAHTWTEDSSPLSLFISPTKTQNKQKKNTMKWDIRFSQPRRSSYQQSGKKKQNSCPWEARHAG